MLIKRCESGHFYDSERFSSCPHCDKFRLDANAQSRKQKQKAVFDRSALQRPFPFMSCKNMDEPYIFVSYAHDDADALKPYFDVLEKNNFRYWYDEGLPSGKDFYEQIAIHIKCAVQFVVFLSANAQKSENVKDEIHIAYKYKKNILVVYIEDVELCDGLELMLDRKQNFLAFKFSEDELYDRFYNELSKDTLMLSDNKEKQDSDVLKRHFPEQEFSDISLISKGGMSEVYSAVNTALGTKVVLKKCVFEGIQNEAFFKKTFMKETEALKKCNCPFIPQLLSVYYDEKEAVFAETFIKGDTLSANGAYSEDFVVSLAIRIVHILKYLYYHGIVHRDIKPNNIIVNEFGDAFLIDFGSAAFVNEDDVTDVSTGTLGFASPEQMKVGCVVDFRSDIYSLGKTMLSLLVSDKISSGNVFSDATDSFCDMTVVLKAPTKVQYLTENLDYYDKNANRLLSAVISKMTSERRENRYNNLDELLRDLEACRRNRNF